MNPAIALTLIYGLMTLGSASILYSSFKGRPDQSAKYFLYAELQTLFAMPLVALANVTPNFATAIPIAITNFLVLASDASIIFSIYSLTRYVNLKHYFSTLAFIGIFCVLIEYCRFAIHPKLPYLMFNTPAAILAFGTFYLCKSPDNCDLNNNAFMKWIGRLEFTLGLCACIRLLSYFLNAPISPRHPSTETIIFYGFYIALSLFRYITYQSLRISWVSPESNNANFLNWNLVKISQEKNQLMQTLMSTNRTLGVSALANSLAHQLSQPLTSIALQTEVIKCDLMESNPSAHKGSVASLNKISRQLEKLADLVKNLRQLFGSGNHQFDHIHLQEVANEVLEIIEPTLQTKRIYLEKIYLSDPITIGNAIQLQQVFINLFNNAIDAIEHSGLPNKKITLSISQDEDFAWIRIQDSGTGISSDLLSTMFNLHKTSKQEGLGIGLWLSKIIIDKHNGNISASNSPDGGAAFEIKLPVAKNESNLS